MIEALIDGDSVIANESWLLSMVLSAGKRKKPVSPFEAVKHWLFVLHSNGLEPLTFGSVVPKGILSRF